MRYEFDDQPPPNAIASLRESVGWGSARDDYPNAYGGYCLTVSAYAADQLVGWAALVSEGVRHAFFVDVIVRPNHQRQGVGKRLVTLALAEMRGRGIRLVHADFAPQHAPFYEACGFTLGGGGYVDLDAAGHTV